MRTVGDQGIIGKVVKSYCMKISILSKQHMPEDTVTLTVKRYLNNKLYVVSNRMQGCNLIDNSIENG